MWPETSGQENHISSLRSQTIRSRMPLDAVQSSAVYQKLDKKLHRKTTRKRAVRYGILGINALLLFGVLAFVLVGQRSGNASPETVLSAAHVSDDVANPLDQVSSADIALNVARMSGLQEGPKIAERADSVDIELSLPPASASIVAKPQVIATALKSKKDIQKYVTVAGDTVTTLATKFGVTSDSIRWSNDLQTNTLNVGVTLYIPPVTGIVYTVKAGDTPDTLAGKFKADKDQIVGANDAELAPLKVGERVLIPNGTVQAPVVNTRVANAGFGWGSGPVYGNNSYTYGYCTWYVANKITVPNNWGNANTWDNRAALSGWVVSSIPRAGAVGQTDRGSEGHVGVVEAVSPDGTQIKYSDMNGLAGWGRAGYSDWVSASKFEHYIYQ
ncbi:MAG: putative domain containing protein [Candidatus Saccharibacteria bacterium]|nr:putative domain containing protein [Candidatus Saccharibacteria bacterium]